MKNIVIGNTPLVELTRIKEEFNLKGHIFAKVESYNPAGSVKDRIAFYMIKDAEGNGKLKPGSVIIEPTSGNTGIGLAYIGRELGYRVILTMPSSMSIERRNILKGYGAELVLTDASLGMKGAIAEAERLNKEIPDSIILGQFDNPSNPKAHYETTGPEIYKQLNGKVDALVAGVGTGGTITGTGRYLKEHGNTYVVAVEPSTSPVLSQGVSGKHGIQGIGAGFVPSIFDRNVVDEVITVDTEDAFAFGRQVRELDDVSVGISSGAALKAAIELARRDEFKDKNIVVIFPDGGDRYFSTKLFIDE